jgi:hypothetical protein
MTAVALLASVASLVLAVPARASPGERAGPAEDARECSRLCAGAEDEEALRRRLAAGGEDGWRRLHAHFQRWRWCMDGSASETPGVIVRHLLADRWRSEGPLRPPGPL